MTFYREATSFSVRLLDVVDAAFSTLGISTVETITEKYGWRITAVMIIVVEI